MNSKSQNHGDAWWPDGGPAFAVGSGQTPSKGMSLRDYFAAAALADGFLDNFDAPPDAVAKLCYSIADAMLREREAGNDMDHHKALLRRAIEAIETLADLVPLDDEDGTNKWTIAEADLVRQDLRNALGGQDDT